VNHQQKQLPFEAQLDVITKAISAAWAKLAQAKPADFDCACAEYARCVRALGEHVKFMREWGEHPEWRYEPDQVLARPRRRKTILTIRRRPRSHPLRPMGLDDAIANYERALDKPIEVPREESSNTLQLRTPGRKAKGQRVVAEYIRRTYPDGLPPDISYDVIAEACGVDERTVRRALGLK
jgi:hypothetical protein